MANLTTPTRAERAIADNAEPFPHVDVVVATGRPTLANAVESALEYTKPNKRIEN